ncbi:hypothetical protein RJ640_024540 [Escallonia rubra]|uniref:DYW domain-containing protein n=1 Tax=Escallonia rubra TaxID=112253 RepID=A0AA88UMU3_9ASTE|nr:hypothetical protein RJ640_024540 [Escallonia rubra]
MKACRLGSSSIHLHLTLDYQTLLSRAGPRLKPLQQVHAQLILSGLQHSLPHLTKLLTLACASGSILYTRHIFFSIPRPDPFLFSSLINATTKSRFPLDTLLFYQQMLLTSTHPSSYTYTSVIKACAGLSSLRLGRNLHTHAFVSGFGLDVYVQAGLVSFYAKCGELDVARKMFDEMPERTVVAWNSMISGYEQNGLAEEAIGLFNMMRDLGFEFDSATFVSVLSACSQLGAFGLGCWVHEYVENKGIDVNVVLGTAFINMYARCGNVRKAREIFDWMDGRNVVAWTAMISAYGMHGYGREAIDIFHMMKTGGPPPNDVTFIAVLSACAHAGLVSEGHVAFASMTQEYAIVPGVEHHVCMVDMLGRAGLLFEAIQYVKDMKSFKPATAAWTALLGACKMHKNVDLGVQVAENLLAAEPDNPGHYVLLSNIYAMAGRMDRVEMVRNAMIQKGLKKQVGYSTIEIDQKMFMFSMGDKSHPETNKIYQYLDELMQRCRAIGYVPTSESVMHELEDEEREYALRYHSEKLAIAFGLLRTSHGLAIRIVKNLRMCEDCHTAIKYISVVSNREIIVRDKLRFHHFRDGSCSCVDYW